MTEPTLPILPPPLTPAEGMLLMEEAVHLKMMSELSRISTEDLNAVIEEVHRLKSEADDTSEVVHLTMGLGAPLTPEDYQGLPTVSQELEDKINARHEARHSASAAGVTPKAPKI